MQGVPFLKLVAAIIVLTAITSVIMLIPDWNGEQASTAADDIDTLLDVGIVLSSFVFSIVMVMLGYSLWRWRAKPGDESDGQPIHGNTRLEIAWTVIPTVIVVFLAIYSWIVLDDIEAKDPDRMKLEVVAQQFEWDFNYPDAGVTSKELHVPVDRQLEHPAPGARRAPFLLGAGVADQAGSRPGRPRRRDRRQHRRHPGPRGHLQRDLHRALRRRARDDEGYRGGRVRGRLPAVALPAAADPAAGAVAGRRGSGIMAAMNGAGRW